MTNTDRAIGEDDLHGYVDGLLDADRHAQVERYLDAHPDVAARVGEWQADSAALRHALATRAAEPVPSNLLPYRLIPDRHRHRWPGGGIAAGIAVAFVLGTGAGWIGRGAPEPHGLASLGQQAAVAQRVFASDPQPIARENGRPVLRVGLDAGRPGRAVLAPDLSAAGYTLLGGRLVPTRQGSAALFEYGRGGQRIGVMVRLMVGIDTDAAMRSVPVDGVTGYAWSRRGVGFSVVSDQPGHDLHAIADVVRASVSNES